jgi:hypothetical protein
MSRYHSGGKLSVPVESVEFGSSAISVTLSESNLKDFPNVNDGQRFWGVFEIQGEDLQYVRCIAPVSTSGFLDTYLQNGEQLNEANRIVTATQVIASTWEAKNREEENNNNRLTELNALVEKFGLEGRVKELEEFGLPVKTALQKSTCTPDQV